MALLSELVKFSDFCDLLRRLKKAPQATARKYEFEKFFKQRNSDVSFQSEELLPFLRILLSSMDNERRFDMKDKKLAQRIGKVLGVPAAKLIPLDSMSTHHSIEQLAAEVAARVKTNSTSALTVDDVNNRLDRMSDKELRDPDDGDFEFLFQHCSAEELIWIFNVIVRNVEKYVGASSSSLLALLDDDAQQRWTLSRSLSAVVEDILPTDCIIGRNFRPMLLARLPRLSDWWQQIAAHSGTPFYAELKYDGEHVLLHKIDKHNYMYYTRNGKDFSDDYGRTWRDGSVSNRIDSFFVDSCVDCVLDCELVLYDKQTKKICRHNATASDGQTHSYRYVRPELQHRMTLAVVLFDVLHYNGRTLLNVPLEERIKVLERGVLKQQAEDTIYIAKRRIMNARFEVEEFFAEAMKEEEEGIVVKCMKSLYIPGSRAKRNGWFKLKPNLTSSCALDLAVVAILPRQGHHNKDAYLLAARDEDAAKMVVVGCVSVGLSDLDRRRIYEDATRACMLRSEPHESVQGRAVEQGRGGYIHPHHMHVVEVTCTGIRGRKLIDPVVRCIREKPIEEIDSVAQFEEMAQVLRECRLSGGRDAGRCEEVEESKKVASDEVVSAKRWKGQEATNARSGSLAGKVVCVLQGVDSKLRERAFRILARFGAKGIANPADGTAFVVAITRAHPRTRNVIGKAAWSVVDVRWLIRCDEADAVTQWNEDELIYEAPSSFKFD